jgi:hypothetical protein
MAWKGERMYTMRIVYHVGSIYQYVDVCENDKSTVDEVIDLLKTDNVTWLAFPTKKGEHMTLRASVIDAVEVTEEDA